MTRSPYWKFLALFCGATLGLGLVEPNPADACGCFTPPDPSVPIVQAGERIAFSMANGEVTAHIQIQYAGNAGEFGWILPLPSVPKLELGSDELFTQLTATTQPKYRLTAVYDGNCAFNPANSRGGFGGPTAAGSVEDSGKNGSSPLVYQDSVGPYDYAVLKADKKDEMLAWLATNRYFVPAGTDASVGPYIHPGAFFLALKLKSGNSTGDLQPVVLRYASDLPMIPIVLTSVAAQPNMGIQVWMLGKGRAIPRNYYHTVINDSKIDWLSAGANYNDVIIAATKEAIGRHTFVTEYAGSTSVMQKVLNSPGRFGTQAELAAQPDAVAFVDYLNNKSFAYTGQLTSLLGRYIPVPASLLKNGFTAQSFYQNISYYLGSYRTQNPQEFVGYSTNYVPVQMAQEITDRVVTPTLAAGAMFDTAPYLTRLYTTLSAEDMNKDPVFSFNPSLPDYANLHEGTITYHCGFFGSENQSTTSATLKTAAGWQVDYPAGTGQQTGTSFVAPAGPSSQVIEILGEEGAPQSVTDNTSVIAASLSRNEGCDVSSHRDAGRTAGLAGLTLLAVAVAASRRKRAR